MRRAKLLLALALMSALVLVGSAIPQTTIEKKVTHRDDVVFPSPSPLSVNDVVERLMAFDKNKDGKITKDELPERMHHLFAQGDTNMDGALDKEELKKLASVSNAGGPLTVRGGPVPFGPGPVPIGGPPIQVRGGGQIGFNVSGRAGPGPGGFSFGSFGPGVSHVEGVVDDLKLAAKKKEQALAVAKEHNERLHKLMGQARVDMLSKMKEVLSEEEFKDFEAALDRPRAAISVVAPAPVPKR